MFVMPAPLIDNVESFSLIVNALAPVAKTMPSKYVVVSCVGWRSTVTLVVLEVPNVAVSANPLGTVDGVQLLAVFQSPVAGLVFHVALPAKLLLAVVSRSVMIVWQDNRSRATSHFCA